MLNNLKEKIDIKTILIIVLTIVVLVLAFGMSLLIMNNIEKDREERNTTNTAEVDKKTKYQGTITRVEEGKVYFKTEGSDEEESADSNCKYVKEGDTLTYKVNDDGKKYDFYVRVEKDGKEYTYQLYEYWQTNTTTEKTSRDTTIVTSSSNNTPKSADDAVLSYIKDKNNEFNNVSNNEDNKKKAKEYFTTLVDFIFYGGKIQGHTFNELSTSAKEKTIYLTLKIDGIIDKNIPGYKNTLSDSYKNAKNDLLANYTDYSTKVCSENKELCDDLKRDTEDLKKSLNITWSIIKDIYNEIIKPAGKGSVEKLSNWYEVWKNA